MSVPSAHRTDSADGAFVVVPDDGADLPTVPVAINVSQSGTVAFIGTDGNQCDVFIAAGIAFPLRCRRILATGTTAQGIRGLVR